MNRLGAQLLAVLSFLAVLLAQGRGLPMTINIAGGGSQFIQVGDTWRYLKGTAAPSNPADAWTKLDFVDSSWLSGPTGIGYGDGDDATVLSDMQGASGYLTVYARKQFTVASVPADETLALVIDYDDGFIAYLNGSEVARAHMPAGAATYQTPATSHEAGTPETFTLGRAGDFLQVGANVLAIEGHNTGTDSGDFSLIPALRTAASTVKDGDTWIVDAATVPLSGTTSAATATSVKIGGEAATFNPADRTWSGTATLSSGLNTILVEAFDAAMTVVDSGTIKVVYVPASNRVSGTLAADTVWSGAYIVEGQVTVPAGVTLTIQAGSVIMFRPTISLMVQGRLLADGTEDAPIRFTHHGDGTRWKQIMFVAAADSRLAHCTLDYADSVGDHQDYYLPGPRNYHEAFVVLASHVDLEACTFTRLPVEAGEGDAVAIFSDDQDHPGPASGTFRECRFVGVGQGIHTRFSHVTIEDCYFQNKHGDNDDVDLWGESDPPCVIRNNLFDLPEYDDRINPTRCSAIIEGNTIMGSNDHGLVLRDKGSPIVKNNLILNCSAGGIAVENSCTALLVNNTIIGCGRGLRLFDLGRWDSPYFLNPGGGTATVINCVIRDCNEIITLADSSNTTIADKGSHITVINSNVEGGRAAVSVSGSQSTVTWGAGNIDADPLFADAANKDYRLKPGSPSIDTGTADQAPATDQDGHPRPCGAGFDMGAYEYCESLPPVFQRGDANADGNMDISDAVTTLLYLFIGGVTPPCLESADADDDGEVVISDPIYLLRYLFLAGDAPPPPLGACGPDTKADDLTCDSFPPCP